MSWDAIKRERDYEGKAGGGSNLFISLKDGESVEGVFRGEPHTFYQIFKDKVEYDKWVEGSSFRFKIPFVVKENGSYVAKIFQGSKTVSVSILDVKEEYGLDCLYKIKRTGSGKEDTRYTILFKGNLSEEELAQVETIKLPRLKREASVDDLKNRPASDDDPFPASEWDESNPPPVEDF